MTRIVELATTEGVEIEMSRLRGKLRAKMEDGTENLNTIEPTSEYWAVFHSCSKNHLYYSESLQCNISQHTGQTTHRAWIKTNRNIQYKCCKDDNKK